MAVILILIMLMIFVLLMNADVVRFVIAPLESMFEKVAMLSKDPMAATRAMLGEDNNKLSGSKEIHQINKSVSKIAYLLVIGYGEAGTSIIIKNMGKGSVSVEIPGEKIIGIYGFCDIRNFTDATEVL